jgi:serine protease
LTAANDLTLTEANLGLFYPKTLIRVPRLTNAGLTIVLISLASVAFGQKKSVVEKFTLPKGATRHDYQPGVLLAKLKPEFRDMGTRGNSGSRVSSLPGAVIRPLANTHLTKQNRSARGPYANPKIDLGLYVQLTVSPGTDIEKQINDLYATGYFEIVEPSYIDRVDFTPNDPNATAALQYYLSVTKAFDAWDISKSDGQTVIAIVDTGGDLDHPDLASKLYINPDETSNNGIDDDNDGYIDNVNGWDFVGDDTLHIFDSNFLGDNNPQLVKPGNIGTLGHGVWVAGCAAAATNNGTGIAGVGFNAKLLFTKHTADNQRVAAPNVYFGYEGILYAAQTLTADNVPRKIINASWGGTFRSQISQDILTHVTLDLGCLVVSAAGNSNSSASNYPAAYDHVLSVAATDQNDVRATFSNFGPTVDLAAPGVAILSTQYDNVYGSVQGTSFSSPITAGAAALVWSHFPTYTPEQVAEQLRVTADNIDNQNISFIAQLGKGRLNIKNALTLSMPSIRVSKPILLNAQGNIPTLGEESFLTLDFTNFLAPTTAALTATASSTSPLITFSKTSVSLGVIGEGATIRNSLDPIRLSISANTPENTTVTIKLNFSDGVYTDFAFIEVLVNPSFLTIDKNKIITSIGSTGRLGYDDPANSKNGVGFVFNENSILFEMGLITGTSGTAIYNNVRGTNNSFEQDFTKVTSIRRIEPGTRTSSEIYGSFAPAVFNTLNISYRSMVMKESPSPNDKFVILEYTLKNNGSSPVSNFHFGIFADWDISSSGSTDAAGWDAAHRIGYVFPKGSNALPHAGIQVLNRPANYYAIDNSQAIDPTSFGLYDGFTRAEKYTAISTERLAAGQSTPAGNDVSHVVSATAVDIPAGGEVVIAFALHAANNLNELLASAEAADLLYNTIFNIPRPVVPIVETCYGAPATLQAGGASNLNWYRDFTGGTVLQTGSSFTTGNLLNDTILYVSNADGPYESVRAPAEIKLKAKPLISASPSAAICGGQTTVLSVAAADEYLWNTGATTQSINVTAEGDYSVTIKYNPLNCITVSPAVSVKVKPSPVANFGTSSSLNNGKPIAFSDQSTGAVSWQWEFGDGTSSGDQNPTKIYPTAKNYSVSLKVTGANGCQSTITKQFDVVTGLEHATPTEIIVFPNPASDNITIQVPGNFMNGAFEMLNANGQQVIKSSLDPGADGRQTFSTREVSSGVYIIRLSMGNAVIVRKVVIRH